MKEDKDKNERNMSFPEDDVAEEIIANLDPRNTREGNIKAGRIDMPQVEVEEGQQSEFKDSVAQISGKFSDQVLMGSPASEAAEENNINIGRTGLEEIIAASDKKLEEKMND
ncbi:hypothetical protein MWH28_00175 [Natroniella sulfidigena]|uniref:hypothetical protein n=1 Tax=Natroniella sulfidigena TaxID=723921 RepID=UPI00200A822C|nr:hypothetical protein [Natroniella sulfidigena]MCK8815782.1 hypothetical protein [Natroniella sulfidigena]